MVADEARAWYERGIEQAGGIGFRPEVALAHLGLAEVIVEHFPSDLAEAREHLAFAVSEFEVMRMGPALERARALEQRRSKAAPGRHS